MKRHWIALMIFLLSVAISTLALHGSYMQFDGGHHFSIFVYAYPVLLLVLTFMWRIQKRYRISLIVYSIAAIWLPVLLFLLVSKISYHWLWDNPTLRLYQ